MEVDLFSRVVSEEDTVEVDVENDNFGVEGERCGICMDIVVDRGVLDCCQHWFCFLCIDNWASITNLCPLCQNEFQLITCVPVYDTIGGSKTDEDSDLRDDDWCAEGENNTLSFPSYYIDENAVTCLDGDGCKIRSGSVTYEETSTFDTSIACDSCDIWYHAYCVGFNPEGADVDSWLCPRCIFSEAQNIPDFRETHRTQNQLDSESADRRFLVDTYSGKVCISVADAGETAVVVSRIGGEHVVEESIANEQHTRELSNHHETEISMLQPDSSLPGLRNSLDHGINDAQPEATVPCAELHESIIKSEPNESDSRICLKPELSLGATMSEDDKTEVLLDSNDCLHDPSGKSISTDETSGDGKVEVAPSIGEKQKRTDYSFLTNDEDGYDEVRLGSGYSTRKVKARKGLQRISSKDPTHISASDDQKTDSRVESSADETGVNGAAKKSMSIDIMSIVQDKEPKTAKRLTHQKVADNHAKVENNAARLRMKKIMRRPSDDQESADVVQKLRKEIREAVRKKPSDDFGKSIFDPNLLAAFRVVVAGSATGPVKKASAKAKKFIFQKGKTRENLTKKIYATSNGKRRRAWDRDCEVEFWRHRCITTSKREKIETLKSVLNLLKKSPETKKVEHDSEEEAKAPILSRLYLADASVFPRKDDIKPLSVLKAAEMATKPPPDHCTVKSSDSNEVLTQGNTSTADGRKIEDTCAHKNGVASGKLNSDRPLNKSSSQKKTACKTDIKTDKRKWALEVLARKTASNNTSHVHKKQGNAVFKGNYPLLAELPTDMRPKLAPIHHNKVPVSVRQAQLYRLTEHFLKMANLSSIRRAAATELAVADAINIEKQVADKSNSKSVYLNLCSQEIRHHTNCNTSSTPVESTPSTPLPVSNESKESSSLSLDSEAEAALRAAGLLSDSPPCSPHHSVDHDGSPVMEVDEEETEDIFGMDSYPDLDIYGDFEYDLDEEYDMGASVIKPSESQAVEGESKVKVVFSTLISNKTDSETETLLNTSSLLGSSAMDDDKADSVPIPADTSMDGEDEELSLAECEELYGPEKELLVNKYPVVLSTESSGPQSSNNLEVKKPEENKNDSAPASCVGEKSPTSSQAVKNAEEKNGDFKVDKKSGHVDSVHKKVEAYIKEHIRPLCKSGVITVEQYRWAVGKTTDKVMKYHSKAKNANFLIKEGEKVKKLAEQYVDAAQHKEK